MPKFTFHRTCLVIGCLALSLLYSTAYADPADDVTVTLPPDGQGDAQLPGSRTVSDLPEDYVEEEFFVAGAATLYNYGHNPPLSPTDTVAIQEDVPYQTRLIVRRPAQTRRFNGTVVIEWWNSTAGFDTAPVWDASAEYFARQGIAYVGVTNSTTSLGFLVGGCRFFGFLPPACGTRYATLSLPENGLAYDMMSQIANLLKYPSADNPLPADYNVELLFHSGESQQAGSIVTYASGFHFDGVNDGYFVQAGITARAINFGPACGSEGSPPYPDCTPRLIGSDRLVRTDLSVPVYQVMTQLDIEILFGLAGRQSDSAYFRYYEVAGGGHLSTHKDIVVVPAGVFGPNPILLEDLCQNEINSTADGPVFVSHVFNALWERMIEQASTGAVPPAGVLMDTAADALVKDAFGNGTGGVRLPALEVPLATYVSGNQADPNLPPVLQFIGNLACALSGSVFPFDQGTVDSLYPDHGAYVGRVARSVNVLKQQGLLLQRDAVPTKVSAAQSDIGE